MRDIKKCVENPRVKIRYYTGQKFHAKFYIAENVALVGSANLTDAGLKSNREISVTIRRDDHPAFDALKENFEELWGQADVVTESILSLYTAAFTSSNRPPIENTLDEYLANSVPKCEPPSVTVGSRKVSGERLFLQNFRRRYDEVLVPAIQEVEGVFQKLDVRHSEFIDAAFDIEMSRFLGWLRLEHAPGDSWQETTKVDQNERESRLKNHIQLWVSEDNIAKSDMYSFGDEIKNISRIRTVFASPESISAASGEELVDALTGCHAFKEQLRFTKGGEEQLKAEFLQSNTTGRIKNTLTFLLHGPGDQIQRAYDCIHDPIHKLNKFAESCTMELIGWLDPKRPPINGRTIKALRFIGFNAT